MPSSSMNGLPGADAMTDTLEFVRNMWGSMKMPGMAMPSLSPDEINKQITDLKAVESWLQLNMTMLRSSIQALEVQSATLTALQSMSQSFTQAVNPSSEANDKPLFESPFAAFNAASDKPADKPEEKPAVDGHAELPDPTAMAAQFANPAAWWNVVQDQFSQAVNSVVTPPMKKKARKTTAAKKTVPTKKSTTATKKAAPASAARKKKSSF